MLFEKRTLKEDLGGNVNMDDVPTDTTAGSQALS